MTAARSVPERLLGLGVDFTRHHDAPAFSSRLAADALPGPPPRHTHGPNAGTPATPRRGAGR